MLVSRDICSMSRKTNRCKKKVQRSRITDNIYPFDYFTCLYRRQEEVWKFLYLKKLKYSSKISVWVCVYARSGKNNEEKNVVKIPKYRFVKI